MRATGSARLRRWILVYAVAAMVAISVAVAMAVVVPMQRHMVAAAERGLAHSLDLQALAIGEAQARLRDLASQVTSRTVIRDALIRYNRGAMSPEELRTFTADKLADALRLAPEMRGIVRRDRAGRVVVRVGEELPEGVLHPGAIMLTDGGPRLAVDASIDGPDGQREGTDTVLFDAAAIDALVRDGRPLGATWRSAVYVDAGDGMRAVLPAYRAGAAPAFDPGAAAATGATAGRPVSVAGGNGAAVAAYAGAVPGTGWLVAVWMDEAELYYDVDRLIARVAGGVAGLAAVGALGMVLVLKPLTGRMLVEADTLAREVEDKERTVAALQRTQRTLRTLSGGNQALIHAGREEDLLNDMCRIMVEVGGYAQARVAMNGPAGLTVVAERRTAGADGPAGAGSADLAGVLATGTPAVLSDPVAATLLLLPLSDPDGPPLGVVEIAARDGGGFDAEERALLEEMVSDLAFGIVSLRMRAAWQADQERLERTLERTIQAIATTIEVRDPFTAGHQRRVGELAAAIAAELRWPAEAVKGVFVAGIIHDIGKIAVPAEILSRPGALNPLEFELVRAHAESGAAIVAGIEFPWPVATAIAQHHERLDGSGYPCGLTGDAIIPEARILAVADVLDAMISHRPYRPACTLDEALAEITAHRGSLYDPAVVDACAAIVHRGGVPAGVTMACVSA
ncbi:HD-GYP domain-containing protein [Azospirillum halopraeferens]|uniref:HD-GYP domain-containing protein n=1 Tax=Azospirillum halopraeferens TaxID=34010 RepID=UPI0004138ED8|nr:HD-GYP domain-containing protein [Azospirillum halopraeferens]